MTSVLQPHHMYASSGIQFTDPFASRNRYCHHLRDSPTAYQRYSDFSRALTPPPEMSTAQPPTSHNYYQQERGHRNGDFMPGPNVSRAPTASYAPRDSFQPREGSVTQTSSRTISPVSGSRQPIFDSAVSQAPHPRSSQVNDIAPSFQIPRSVNDSGGSLSELAAQITCLFWFESAEILQQAEESVARPSRQLVMDAKPTTGFRKWVTTILATTMVAQNVVLLALLFIYRLKKLNPTVRGKPGSEYRLLTVALMLGNKFLDDNTYTNKTWAEVSGIVVGEVHIMEVEFLSNMKYCLFTSAEDWTNWQSLLGKFAAFFESAQQPPRPAPVLPPTSSLHLPMALPSPPVSNQASPPYAADLVQTGSALKPSIHHGPTPAPSPLAVMGDVANLAPTPRKRSREDYSTEPPAKRHASSYQSHEPVSEPANGASQRSYNQPIPRLTLPSLGISTSTASTATHAQASLQSQQLPPLTVPGRAMAMVYSNASVQPQTAHIPAPSGQASGPSSQYHSRHASPYPVSGTASPTDPMLQSSTSLHLPSQISPTYFLQQRNSPYRPVHNVSTLLYPPSSAALQNRAQNVEYDQMHYQPLGKAIQQKQTGRLPYLHQNIRTDNNNHQQPMTPVHQWPSFQGQHQHPLSQSQQ